MFCIKYFKCIKLSILHKVTVYCQSVCFVTIPERQQSGVVLVGTTFTSNMVTARQRHRVVRGMESKKTGLTSADAWLPDTHCYVNTYKTWRTLSAFGSRGKAPALFRQGDRGPTDGSPLLTGRFPRRRNARPLLIGRRAS